jgi:hypothetical protein
MVQLRPGGEVAFELNPVELLHVLLGVSVDEGVKLAICHAIEDPAVASDVHGRVEKLDSGGGIACGGDGISVDPALGRSGAAESLGSEAAS